MAGTRIDQELLYRVATAYYIEKKQQREIADELQVSRVQISKYLKMAEERGLVRIEIVPPVVDPDEQRRLHHEFTRHFAVRDVLVCPSYGTHDTRLRSLIEQAGSYLWEHFGTGELVVGLGWGRTVHALAEHLPVASRRHWQIVPLAGGSNRASEKYFNINHLVQTLAERIGARPQAMYLPLVFDTRAGHQSLIQSDEYRHISRLWDGLDLIVCSLGGDLAGSPLFKFEARDPEYLDNLRRAEAVGDMLTHFYDLRGRIVELGIEDRMINISYDQLMKAKNRLVIVSGTEKTDAILGALRARFIDLLVIDRATALQVLERNRSAPLARSGGAAPGRGPSTRGRGAAAGKERR
jgi:deoxyribonucleoside regulator